MIDLAVVGGGVMGAPAAAAAKRAGASVVVFAPPEPDDPAGHDGVFGAHYDRTRLAWRAHTDPVETELAVRSIRELAAGDDSLGRVLEPRGMLFVSAPGLDEGHFAALDGGNREAFSVQDHDADSIARRWPQLRFPTGVRGSFEEAPSGQLDPRRMVARYLAAVDGELIPHAATSIEVDGDGVTVGAADGGRVRAGRALVATGAFTNQLGLLPEPLALRLKTETVVQAYVDEETAEAFSALPPFHYQVASAFVGEAYATPPVQYPDGSWRIKLGANTIRDRWLDDVADVKAWYRSAGTRNALPLLRRALLDILPEFSATVWESSRCAITQTPHGHPYIDELIPGRLYVATGGNGHAAKMGPALGVIAADLALTGTWNDPLPRDWFEARTAADPGPWTTRDLFRNRR
jgi:glycine/D-amino acid oxidase-like deaminating enzyme